MLYYLIGLWAEKLNELGLRSVAELFHSIMFRTAAASFTAFLLCVLFGPRAIRWLGRRWREPVGGESERLVEMREGKRNTPTMGGAFVLASLVAATLVWGSPAN